MQIIISVRHGEVTHRVREAVEHQLRRLSRFEPRLSRAEVALLEEKNRCEVEAKVSVERMGLFHARAEGPELPIAVNRVVDKLARQLRRSHSRRQDHQGVPKPDRLLIEEPEP